MRFGRIGLALALLLAAGAPMATAKDGDIYAELKAGWEKFQARDCKGAVGLLDKAMRRPDFAGLPADTRGAVYELVATCDLDLERKEEAYRHAMAGTAIKPASEQLWRIRFWSEIRANDNAAAVDTIEAMARQNPEALNNLPPRWFGQMARDLRKETKDKAIRLRLVRTLAAPTYQPTEAGATNEGWRLQYAGLLADAGDKAAAADLVRGLEEPALLIRASVDPRLRDALPADYDFRAATERALAKARDFAASHAGSMSALLEVAQLQRMLGRPQEALATLEAARPDGPQGKDFTDLADQRNWWWDSMARSYQALGRYEDSVAAFREGIDAKEGGVLNVSQTINLGNNHLLFGHYAKALETVGDFEKRGFQASPYGLMQMRSVQGCARVLLGLPAAKDDIAYMTAHEKDAPAALADMLICADDLDGAATSLIRRLDDPEERAEALLDLSDYDPPPPGMPRLSFDEPRKAALKARPDVQAAIKRAGGLRRFHLQAGEF